MCNHCSRARRREGYVKTLIAKAKGQVGEDEPMAATTAAAIAEVQAALHAMRVTIRQDADLASTLPTKRRPRHGAPMPLTAGAASLRSISALARSGEPSS